jgi:hypothetical protein
VLSGQGLQLVWFGASWYAPGGQSSAACPTLAAYAPGTDTQAARLAEPAGDCVSAGSGSPAASISSKWLTLKLDTPIESARPLCQMLTSARHVETRQPDSLYVAVLV